MESIAALASPQADRLVWSVNHGVAPAHGERLGTMARGLGLATLAPLPPTVDLLAAGVLTDPLLHTRFPYADQVELETAINEMVELDLITRSGDLLEVTAKMTPLTGALVAAQKSIAVDLWDGHDLDVTTVNTGAAAIAATTDGDHAVAVVHRELPLPAHPAHACFHRLVTLRYIRQHDHIAAWRSCGLTVQAVVALTSLWNDDEDGPPAVGLGELIEAGLATPDSADARAMLTTEGRTLRNDIEAETNRRNDEAYAVLGDRASDFVDALSRLPGDA